MKTALSRRYVIPTICVIAFAAADAATGFMRRHYPQGFFATSSSTHREVQFFETPFPLTAFEAVDLDGRNASLSSLRGRVALVNFWATWCAPCRAEIPALVALQAQFKTDLAVIGVLDDGASTAFLRAFMASLHVNYPIVRTTAEIEGSFSRVLVLPTTYVLDRDGRVVSVHAGQIDPSLVEREVRALIAAGEPATARLLTPRAPK